jgi:RNA polymerase-associated protein CTR9
MWSIANIYLMLQRVHHDVAEQLEQQTKQRLEVTHQIALADEARGWAEEQRKFPLERRKQEDELKQVMQQEQQFG